MFTGINYRFDRQDVLIITIILILSSNILNPRSSQRQEETLSFRNTECTKNNNNNDNNTIRSAEEREDHNHGMAWKNRTDPAIGKQYPVVDKTFAVERMLVEEAYCSTIILVVKILSVTRSKKHVIM